MKIREVRFWIVAMPIISLLVGGATVGLQYARKARMERELKEGIAEIMRLDPNATANSAGHHDEPGHKD